MTLFSEPTPRSSKRRISAGLVLFGIFLLGVLAAGFVGAPYVIERPGPAVNVLAEVEGQKVIAIAGEQTYATSGALELLTVSLVGSRERPPSWLDLLQAWLDPTQSILPMDQVYPANQTIQESDAESAAMMEQSQQDAIYVALSKLGYKIPTHIYVSEVKKNAPASGKLKATDYIEAVNGEAVSDIDQLREKVNAYGKEQAITISVARAGETKNFDIKPVADADGRLALGIYVGYKYDFPVQVNLTVADIGGPSGGMMFALGIYDVLTPGKLTGGQNIAGTGTISTSGEIGPIGGIRQKLYSASNAGAKFFLAPSENCTEVIDHIPTGLEVFSVKTFDQARLLVEAIGKKSELTSFARCAK